MAHELHALILAAGKGTRMGGQYPKVLATANGRPLINWVLDELASAGVHSATAVVGFQKEKVTAVLPRNAGWVEQEKQLGTGHAVLCAEEALSSFNGTLIVTCGDMPLIRASTFESLTKHHSMSGADCTVLTSRIAPPHRYGRIVRDPSNGRVLRIVEAADATPEQLAIDEVNTGVYCFQCPDIFSVIKKIGNQNKQGEYYLTDAVAQYLAEGKRVEAVICPDATEARGVNNPDELKEVETVLIRRSGRFQA